MLKLFQDESGECSFSPSSRYKYFLITIISIDSTDNKRLKLLLKNKFAKFIKNGWPKEKEPKAFELYKNERFGKIALTEIFEKLITINSLKINYIIINKSSITNPAFTNAPYGIAYNYFTGILLSDIIFNDKISDLQLTYDKRNKEIHPMKHFEDYLQTRLYGSALENDLDINVIFNGEYSHKCYGLLAVDYISWAIYRKFERRDDYFYQLFEHKINHKIEWYIKK